MRAPEASPRAQRQPLFRNATLILDGGSKLTVAIKDLNETGARIEFFVRTPLTGEVVLVESTRRLRRAARVVWQCDGVAGLAFIETKS